MEIRRVTLTGRAAIMAPLDHDHAADILEALRDGDACRFLRWGPLSTSEEAHALIDEAHRHEAAGQALPFAIQLKGSGKTIGSTRLLDIRPKDRQVEVGSTFIAPAYWSSAASLEHRLLLLTHCFEALRCIRVSVKMDVRNTRARVAAEQQGYVQEGILRKERNIKGYQRDTVYYSILEDEWPTVRSWLLAKLDKKMND